MNIINDMNNSKNMVSATRGDGSQGAAQQSTAGSRKGLFIDMLRTV